LGRGEKGEKKKAGREPGLDDPRGEKAKEMVATVYVKGALTTVMGPT